LYFDGDIVNAGIHSVDDDNTLCNGVTADWIDNTAVDSGAPHTTAFNSDSRNPAFTTSDPTASVNCATSTCLNPNASSANIRSTTAADTSTSDTTTAVSRPAGRIRSTAYPDCNTYCCTLLTICAARDIATGDSNTGLNFDWTLRDWDTAFTDGP
jgi:hypothetical protein